MDCTPHIPVRLRKAQAAAIGASFNHAASLFSAVPKIEPKMISAPAHSASDEDEEAASALLGLFGGISSDAAAPDDAVAQRHQTCKRRLCDEVTYPANTQAWLCGCIMFLLLLLPSFVPLLLHDFLVFVVMLIIYVQVAVDFDTDKMRMLKRPLKPFPARRSTEFGSAAKRPWQLQSGQMLPPPLPPTSQLQCVG